MNYGVKRQGRLHDYDTSAAIHQDLVSVKGCTPPSDACASAVTGARGCRGVYTDSTGQDHEPAGSDIVEWQ
jgi:hypothetical protein